MKRILALTIALGFTVMNTSFMTAEVLAASRDMERAEVGVGEITGRLFGIDGTEVL